ncbi:anti-sigma factor domain-containing protein [Thermaerobacter sp. PB12/4term]|uniref:anti-sigma factor domain-containing protein n=1 Tax=Thermaerobacter sp. PB12/4term TaxID=2293838 RepID=UPI000E3295D2|nr:anti-sigma factor domain-containing protein [Thermaerobacter sp. PB12/4term]QIA26831.1 anti-sigma factor domain-containing protein [Thermaerobacter sp. PB12/4term]
MTTKAVVLEIDGDSAVVLREGGQFLRVPLRGRRWYVGQEVHLDLVVRRPYWRPLLAWAAAAALLVAVFSGFLVTPAAAGPASYVTVDLDPASVGLVTDPWAAVLGVEPLTEAAAALVDPVAWVGLPVDRVVVLLVERAARQESLLPGVVVIAAAPLDDGRRLPPAVRQAVARAQRGAAVVLRQRPEAVAAAVVAVDEPHLGPRLARLARQAGLSVFKTAAVLGAEVEALDRQGTGTALEPAVVGDLLARLASLPPEQVRRGWTGTGRPGQGGTGGPVAGPGGVARPGPDRSEEGPAAGAGNGGPGKGNPGGGHAAPGGGNAGNGRDRDAGGEGGAGAADVLAGLERVSALRQVLQDGILQVILPVNLLRSPDGGAEREPKREGKARGHRGDQDTAGGGEDKAGGRQAGHGGGAGGDSGPGAGPGKKAGAGHKPKERTGSGAPGTQVRPGLPGSSPVPSLPGWPRALPGGSGGTGGSGNGGSGAGSGSGGQGDGSIHLPLPLPGTGLGGSTRPAAGGGSGSTGTTAGSTGAGTGSGATSGDGGGGGPTAGTGTSGGTGSQAGSPGSTAGDTGTGPAGGGMLLDDLEGLVTCQDGGRLLGSLVGGITDPLLCR